MNIQFTFEVTLDVDPKISPEILRIKDELKSLENYNTYDDFVENIIVCVLCVNEKFDYFFKIPRRVKYERESRVYFHKGVEIEVDAKTLSYELRLDHKKYMNGSDIRYLFISDFIISLENINKVKLLKKLDIEELKNEIVTVLLK